MYEGDTVVTPKPAEKRHSSATPRSTDGIRLDSIEDAIAAIKAGQAVVVVDDEDRENEGDMIFAASAANAQLCAFMIRYTSGFICVGMEGEVLDRLGLPPMTAVNEDRKGTAYSLSVDARDVASTGISAEDRPFLAASCAGQVTPRQRSTSPAWLDFRRQVLSARWSTMTAR
jgi:3,4-dihydroxy-2-butanone 4-phosphate synthase